jgi:uncharacterized protein
VCVKYYQYKNLRLSEFCLGGAQLGQAYGIGVKEALNEQDSHELVLRALDLGVNFFDTATGYGKSANILEKALHGKDDVVLATKIGDPYEQPGRAEITYIHDPSKFFDNPDAFLQSTHVRPLGISVYEPSEALDALQFDEIEVFQVPYNAFNTTFDEVILEIKKRDKLVVTRSVFAQGLALMDVKEMPSFFDPIKRELDNFFESMTIPRDEFFLSYVACKNIGPLVIGVRTIEQLKRNIKILENPVEYNMRIPNIDLKYFDPRIWPK